jgi:hypothetical protein
MDGPPRPTAELALGAEQSCANRAIISRLVCDFHPNGSGRERGGGRLQRRLWGSPAGIALIDQLAGRKAKAK